MPGSSFPIGADAADEACASLFGVDDLLKVENIGHQNDGYRWRFLEGLSDFHVILFFMAIIRQRTVATRWSSPTRLLRGATSMVIGLGLDGIFI